MITQTQTVSLLLGCFITMGPLQEFGHAQQNGPAPDTESDSSGDWLQWGGTSHRNNTPSGSRIPVKWDIETGQNIKWSIKLGSQTYGTPVVSQGQIFVGTNNRHGFVERSADLDAGCLICFEESDGSFLWQHLSEKLATGRVHDIPEQGIISVPLVSGKRLWYVTNRGEVCCLDTDGFGDAENDGPFQSEPVAENSEADVIWKFSMMEELGVRPHNAFTCSVTCSETAVFVVTGNGVGADHQEIQAAAPDFIALNRDTGELLWKDSSVGEFTLHGSWSSPAYGVFGGQAQVLFPGGDGWLYSFEPAGNGAGESKVLWKFDCNPKQSSAPGYRGNRCEFLTTPVIYKERIYIAIGTDPENGTGPGCLWCIDPTIKHDESDVSATVAVDSHGKRLVRRFGQAVDPTAGEREMPNPDSAAVWKYTGFDFNGNGEIEKEETWKRTLAAASIKDDLLFAVNMEGYCVCLNAGTGVAQWSHDLWANSWHSQPLIVDGKVYLTDEDGEVEVFAAKSEKVKLGENHVDNSIYASAMVANNILYITDRSRLYAIVSEQ